MKTNTPDYGTNGKTKDGLWIMHPSGDLVTNEEKEKRLSLNARVRHLTRAENEILGMSWKDLEFKQGGRIHMEKQRISP